ncbi:MAG TPA: ATP-binding cassette domain-containing protein, partial [Spirochaetales bacterium]|nr:ATP-binding cassette domain-containing protein [Spirochaetales bacterium]
EILVDGVRLESLDLHEWRKHIGLVLQDIYLFPGTVLENVRVYNDKFTELDVFKALETVHADDFVRRLPHGAYTELAERGGNLSMGEKQLISFARAVVFNADIIIMDEATASVDVVTEKKIQRSMKDLLKGRTAIIVAHRLSSILTADEILFFKNGKIAARGKHHELLAEYPEYEELVRLQFPDLSADAELDEAT